MSELISSLQNPKIKNAIKLMEKSGERRKQGLCVVEGYRELTLAKAAGHEINTLFICRELAGQIEELQVKQLYEVSRPVFEKMAYRENSDGVIALLSTKISSLENLTLSSIPFVIILESVEKPGNLGAILRTADAAGIDAVIVCDPRTDIYNPNVIRSSVGCIFTNQVVAATSEEVKVWLANKGITYYAAALTANKLYTEVNFALPSAIVMGTEADGLSEKWLTPVENQIKIPMSGKIDSLNVSVCTAIIAFEAMRQRKL